MRIRVGWSEIQPDNETDLNWAGIDAKIKEAGPGAIIGLSIAMNANEEGGPQAIPKWVLALPNIKTYKLPAVTSGKIRTVIPSWDPVMQPKMLAFIAKIAAKYDGKVNYLAMGGLGVVIESYWSEDPVSLGFTGDNAITEALAAWTTSSNAIVGEHMKDFTKGTVLVFTGSKPFKNDAAKDALSAIAKSSATKYGRRFGFMDCSLDAHSNTGYLPHELVAYLSATNPVGLQFLTSTKGFGNHTLGGTIAECLDAALALGAQYVEIYSVDANNPEFADTLITYGPKFQR